MYREVGNIITKYIEENGYLTNYIDYQSIEHTVVMVLGHSFTVLPMYLITLVIKQQVL